MRSEPAGDWQDDGVSGQITGNHPFAIGNGCGEPAGNVAQRHIGNGGVEHLRKVGTTTASAMIHGLKTRGRAGSKGADIAGALAFMTLG
jgi:hypothetical protein